MENICLKFPHIFEQINELLNNRTLVKSKEASRTLSSVLENQKARKYQWIRIIQSYLQVSNEFKEDWGIVFAKMSPENMKKFAKYARNFCKFDRLRMEHGWSPMHIAAEFGDLDFFKILADMLSVKNLKGKDGWSLVHSAAQAGNLEIYQFLVKDELFENKNPKTNDGITPLHLAAKNGNLHIYKFISKHVDNINPRMHCDITPLHLAAKYGHLEVCRFICDTLNLDALNNWNFFDQPKYQWRSDWITPSNLALMRGHFRSVGFMIPNDIVFLRRFWFKYFLLKLGAVLAYSFFQVKDPSAFDLFVLDLHVLSMVLFMGFSLSNFYEIFKWTDPISGNEFENFCKWIKSFDQDVDLVKNNLGNVEMLEFD